MTQQTAVCVASNEKTRILSASKYLGLVGASVGNEFGHVDVRTVWVPRSEAIEGLQIVLVRNIGLAFVQVRL